MSRQRQSDENIPNKHENDLQEKDNLENNFSTEEDITVPGISENDGNGEMKENTSSRVGKYNLRPNPTPTTLLNTDIRLKTEFSSPPF